MSQVKYYYDQDTLSYRKIEPTKGKKARNIVLFLLSSVLFAFLGLTLLLNTNLFRTPKELTQARELKNFELQYQLMNRKMNQMEKVLENIAERDNTLYRVYFEANPIPEEQRRAGFGGINRYKSLEGFDNSGMIINTSKRIDVLSKQLVVQSKSLDEIKLLAEDKEKLLLAIPAIQPVQNRDLKRMASGYGMRMHPILKYRKMHKGMDFTAPRGAAIYATGDGVIKRATRSSTFGNLIVIDHGFGYETYYAHLSKYEVKKGQKVTRGDIIGYVGNTGLSAGPHLHYEVHKNGKAINPINFYHADLTPEEYEIMLGKSVIENISLD